MSLLIVALLLILYGVVQIFPLWVFWTVVALLVVAGVGAYVWASLYIWYWDEGRDE